MFLLSPLFLFSFLLSVLKLVLHIQWTFFLYFQWMTILYDDEHTTASVHLSFHAFILISFYSAMKNFLNLHRRCLNYFPKTFHVCTYVLTAVFVMFPSCFIFSMWNSSSRQYAVEGTSHLMSHLEHSTHLYCNIVFLWLSHYH